MIGLQSLQDHGRGVRRIHPSTSLTRALRFQREGLVGIIGGSVAPDFLVTIIVTNVVVIASPQDLVNAIAEKFGGVCERVQVGDDPASVVSVEFTIPTKEHLRDPANFLLSVQRKLMEVVRDLDKVHA